MTKFRITKAKLPEGVKLAKNYKKNVKPSAKEYFPLTQVELGYQFYVPGYTARDLRGVIHMKRRTQGMKFISETEGNPRGTNYRARVIRVK